MGVKLATLVRRMRRDYTLPGCGLLIAPLSLVYILAVVKTYPHIALVFSGEMAAIAIAIILLSFPSLLRKSQTPSSSASLPLWIRLFLILDPAVEFPLLFAFHPTTLAYHPHRPFTFPAPEQLVLQVWGFFVVEFAFQNYVLRFVPIPSDGASESKDPQCGTTLSALGVQDEDVRDGCAGDLMIQFLRPRGALLVAVALMGAPTAWARYAGSLHPMAMAVWVALQQGVQF